MKVWIVFTGREEYKVFSTFADAFQFAKEHLGTGWNDKQIERYIDEVDKEKVHEM